MKQTKQRAVISKQDPWRWVTFSGFWGGLYYLFVGVGLIAGTKLPAVKVNRRAGLVSFLVYIITFVSGGVVSSLIEQLIVRRSAKDQSREAIAAGVLEPSIPLQALGGAAGSVVPFALVLGSSEVARRVIGVPVFEPEAINWPRAIAVTATLSGLASLAVSRIAAWIADDAQHAKRF